MAGAQAGRGVSLDLRERRVLDASRSEVRAQRDVPRSPHEELTGRLGEGAVRSIGALDPRDSGRAQRRVGKRSPEQRLHVPEPGEPGEHACGQRIAAELCAQLRLEGERPGTLALSRRRRGGASRCPRASLALPFRREPDQLCCVEADSRQPQVEGDPGLREASDLFQALRRRVGEAFQIDGPWRRGERLVARIAGTVIELRRESEPSSSRPQVELRARIA